MTVCRCERERKRITGYVKCYHKTELWVMVDEEFYPGKSVGSYVKRSLETMLELKPKHCFSRKF